MTEHVDVLIIGAGLSGIGAAWRLGRERPGTSFVILEARDGDRRHLGSVPLPRRALGLGHVHPELSVPALARRGVAGLRREHPHLHPADRGRGRHHAADPVPHQGAQRRLVVGLRPVDRADHGRDVHLPLPVRLRRLLRLRPRLPAGLPGAGGLRRPVRAPAVLAGRPGPRGQAGGGDRQRRDRGDPGARAGPDRRARHDAAALADLRDRAAGPRRGRRRVAPAASGAGRAPADPGQERRPVAGFLPAGPAPPGAGEAAAARDGDPADRRPGVRGRALHPHLRPVGPAALRGAGGRPVRRNPGRHRVDGHRPHRTVRAGRRPAALRPGARGRHRGLRDRAVPDADRRRAAGAWTAARWIRPPGSPTAG